MKELLPPKIGTKDYVNENCWLVKNLRISPAKRCWYCMLHFHDCPFLLYLIVTLILLFVSFIFLFFTKGEISKPVLINILIVVFAFGYFFNRTTEKLIEANFQERKLREELEEAKGVLEIKVAARTKELRELTKKQEEIIKERTKELQERIAELEKFQKLSVGRELKMIKLKKEIEGLKKELEKYKIKL